MADGDYERGRDREIASIAARLKSLAEARGATRVGRAPARPTVFVLNGWAARAEAWDLCRFGRSRIFSYIEQLDGEPERAIEEARDIVLVGWSMGGSGALRLACRYPEKVRGLVLVAATPRMMEEKETGWKGMSPRRLEALRYGVMMTRGEGFFGVPEGKPNPYCVDSEENLARGLKYLLETDVRADLERTFGGGCRFPVHIFHSDHDGIVRASNAEYLKGLFPKASVHIVSGTEHALPIFIPELIDEAVDSCIGFAAAGQDPA